MPLCDAIWADQDSCHCIFAHSQPFISFSSLLIPFKSYESPYLRAATGAREVALWSFEPSSVSESQRCASRSRTCLPFLHSVFVTNFNNFWHSINFSLLRDMLAPVFLPFSSAEMSWILLRTSVSTARWRWSPQMTSLFFRFPLFHIE